MRLNREKKIRYWNGHEVDANLEDQWLDDLNKLTFFELRSICEGHTREVDEFSRNAHVHLAVQGNFEPLVHSLWNELYPLFFYKIKQCFDREDAFAVLICNRELKIAPKSSYMDHYSTCFLEVRKRHARKTKVFDQETRCWLNNAVRDLCTLDRDFLRICEHVINKP